MIAKVKLADSNSLKKKKTITFRVTENDLNAIKQKAANDGIPYQTLISALVHQYSTGKIKLNL
ncbi:MAG: CopG family antitoxin [SAR324 cluster bacterium]|nr:CopG family antitoxin [SAR324 cluster bacterium]